MSYVKKIIWGIINIVFSPFSLSPSVVFSLPSVMDLRASLHSTGQKQKWKQKFLKFFEAKSFIFPIVEFITKTWAQNRFAFLCGICCGDFTGIKKVKKSFKTLVTGSGADCYYKSRTQSINKKVLQEINFAHSTNPTAKWQTLANTSKFTAIFPIASRSNFIFCDVCKLKQWTLK